MSFLIPPSCFLRVLSCQNKPCADILIQHEAHETLAVLASFFDGLRSGASFA